MENVRRVKNVERCQKMSEGCLGQIKGVKMSEDVGNVGRVSGTNKRVKTSETSEECREQIKRVKMSEGIGRHQKMSEGCRQR